MTNSKLLSVSLERFKSHASLTKVDLQLMNVIIGRNNSGKSSLIQVLLLLKQTLEFPRLEVPLRLEGLVNAFSLRELTYGWPEPGEEVLGPSFAVEWQSPLEVKRALEDLGHPDITTLAQKGRMPWLLECVLTKDSYPTYSKNSISLNYAELNGKTALQTVTLSSIVSHKDTDHELKFTFKRNAEGSMDCFFEEEQAKQLVVALEHFIPYVSIDRRNVGPRDRGRSWFNAFHILFVDSLEALKTLLKGFAFLSSSRPLAPSLYSSATEPIDSLGVSGETAAQLLQSHQTDYVHYLLPNPNAPTELPVFRQETLSTAVNNVIHALGVDGKISIDEIKNVGFRLLFGKANLQHVGRGLTYLLPLVQLGLISDPVRFQHRPNMSVDHFENLSYSVCAFEEPEAHLHPKVQARLAQWFVALAMGRRQIIVETHSDHLVRHLRSLVATSSAESEMEKWLIENVRIISVQQTGEISKIETSGLTKLGGLENWPADFMDESSDTEQEIYLAKFEKQDIKTETGDAEYIHKELKR